MVAYNPKASGLGSELGISLKWTLKVLLLMYWPQLAQDGAPGFNITRMAPNFIGFALFKKEYFWTPG